MKVEIKIYDADGNEAVMLSSCNDHELVEVKMVCQLESADIKIEDLKLALRKLSAK